MKGFDDGSQESGRKKPFAAGNTRDDGSYKVGKNRPPEDTRFSANDGRRRGRRAKGVRNFDTEFDEESRRRIALREGGKVRKVTKRHATIIKTYDNALTKGDVRAASLIFSHSMRIGDQHSARRSELASHDHEELNAWLNERLAVIEASESLPNDEPDAPATEKKRDDE